jgi:hypothetical protein
MPLLEADPRALLAVPWAWRFFMDRAGSNADKFRDLVFKTCRESLPYQRMNHHSALIHHFGSLDVVADVFHLFYEYREPSLLPYFVDLLLSQMNYRGFWGRIGTSSESHFPPVLMTEIAEMESILFGILFDETVCWSARCSAALVLCLKTSDARDPIADVSPLLVEHCNSNSGIWLLQAIVTVLTEIHRRQKPSYSALLRDLFDSCRADYCARSRLELILLGWRESSGAPVTKQHFRDKWLFRSAFPEQQSR